VGGTFSKWRAGLFVRHPIFWSNPHSYALPCLRVLIIKFYGIPFVTPKDIFTICFVLLAGDPAAT
jgi:hypothetical protein